MLRPRSGRRISPFTALSESAGCAILPLYGEFIAGTFELVCSKALLSELAEVLVRPELAIPLNACRDPADNMLLECAVSGNAEWIVSGDKDLLMLHPFHGVKIVSPADLLKHLSA